MKTGLLLVTIATIIYAAATTATAIPGGWTEINITNQHVQEIGKWAVLEHDRVGNDNLKFQQVVSGVDQIVNGINYRLVVDALRLDDSHGRYMAVLFEENPSNPNTRKLISFNPVN